jgi:hypothetical protein
MFEPSHAKRLPIVTLLALVLIPSAAAAKGGGHSHGRGRGASPIGVQSTSQPVKGDPPAPLTTKGSTIPASSLKALTTLPTPPTAPVPTPASVIGAPEPQLGVIAPSSAVPIPLSTTVGSGGSSGVSLPGGGGGSLQDCLAFWDRETHMTKGEWKASCQRSIHRLENLPSLDLLPVRTPNR